jgi:serine/threonine protein kinase
VQQSLKFIFRLYNFIHWMKNLFTELPQDFSQVTTSLQNLVSQFAPLSQKSNPNTRFPGQQTSRAGLTPSDRTLMLQAVTIKGYNLENDQHSWTKAIVKATRRRDGQVVALKFLDSATDEVKVLSYLQTFKPDRHHVIMLLNVITSDISDIIVMPWLLLLDVFLVRYPDTNTAQAMWTQFLEGVHFLHEHNIAHLDLKPENALIGIPDLSLLPHLSIIDFGLSVRVENEGTLVEGYCGTLSWSAPEVGMECGPTLKYSAILADRWSCGRVLQCISAVCSD